MYLKTKIFNMSMIGEGNDTPLQYSCLENPMDGGAWWAAVHGVAESRTRLIIHFRMLFLSLHFREDYFRGL